MRISFNGESRELPDGATVGELLVKLNVPVRHVAVEVNFEVIPRERHDATALHEGDQVEVVTLVGGG